jgi:hypothetical protein
MCIKCHQTLNENTFNTRGWKYVNNKIACIDHAFIDGKLLQQNLNNKLDESLLNKPPSEYFYSKRIDELYIDGFTKYEVFCYYLGKELKKKNSELIKLKHFVSGVNKNSFIFYISNDLKICKTSFGKLEKIKENNKNCCDAIFNLSTLIKHISNEYFIVDWRWFYPYVTIDDIFLETNGLKKKFKKIYVVRNNTHYYAIGPRQ